MAALTRAVGLRTGELAALEVGDLDLDAGTLTYQPRPPAAQTPPAAVTVALDRSTQHLVRAWLGVRERLVVSSAGRVRSLWVSVHGNHDGSGLRRPSGMPLRPNGIRRAHARAIATLNGELAGSPGWEPLPRTPGRFRAAVPNPVPSP